MVTDLPLFQLNVKKWREENGLTGEEWQMYIRNRSAVDGAIIMLVYFLGIGVALFGVSQGWI